MAVKQQAEVTLTDYSDADSIVCWYQLNASATLPSKPTTTQTSQTVSGWQKSEPTISSDADAAKYVYACWQTNWGDGSCEWGDVSMSASFEAAKRAWNKASAAQESVDNIDVGGRNLYIIGNSVAGYINGSNGAIAGAGTPKERTSDFISVTPGEKLVFQVWVTPIAATGHYLWMAYAFYDSEKAFFGARPSQIIGENTGTLQHGTYQITVPANAAYIRISARMYDDGLMKLERGNVATDWTPAPEDLEAYADAAVGSANAEEQQIYIQATAGTTTATPPGAWVEETGESTYLVETGGTEAWSTPVWTTKTPTYRQQYPVTLVAIQRKRIDGTVTCTAPLIDDTTTVIDGGNIITDSVTANAIDATDLHVSAANVDGTLTASQIDTEGLELNISAVTGLGDELAGISDQVNSKASSEDFESLSATVGSMSGTVETALGEGGTVEKLRSDMDTIQAHISLGTIGEGSSMQPAITLDAEGGSSDGFKNVITNTSMSFMYGDETVAEVNKDELDITRTKVTESMQLGNFMWIPLSDGSLAFKWVEG